jgi:hypothetical protein
MIERIKNAVEEWTHQRPKEQMIWRSLRCKAISRSARNFLWRATHDSYKIGKRWENIPNFENRQYCGFCGETESIEHILVECIQNHQEDICP